jgi:hypothetical protein
MVERLYGISNRQSGKPLPETLETLGLNNIAKDLWGSNN